MSTTQNLFHVLGPLTAFAVVGILALVLRWAFGGSSKSLVERKPKTGSSSEYGLLVPIAAPASVVESEIQRLRLEEAGIRATVVTTTEGARLMVFPEDERIARALLAS